MYELLVGKNLLIQRALPYLKSPRERAIISH